MTSGGPGTDICFIVVSTLLTYFDGPSEVVYTLTFEHLETRDVGSHNRIFSKFGYRSSVEQIAYLFVVNFHVLHVYCDISILSRIFELYQIFGCSHQNTQI